MACLFWKQQVLTFPFNFFHVIFPSSTLVRCVFFVSENGEVETILPKDLSCQQILDSFCKTVSNSTESHSVDVL